MACEKRIVRALDRAVKRAEIRVLGAMKNGHIIEEEDITAYLASAVSCEITKTRVSGIDASCIVVPRRSSPKNLAREKTFGADLVIALELNCGDEKINKTISFQAKRRGFDVENKSITFDNSRQKFIDQLDLLSEWTSAAKGLIFEDKNILVIESSQLKTHTYTWIQGVSLSAFMRDVARCHEGDTEFIVHSIKELEALLVKMRAVNGIFIWIDDKRWERQT